MDSCSYCGKRLPRDPPVEVDLGSNTVTIDGDVIFLRPAVAEVLYTIVARYPDTATFAHLSAALWGATAGPLEEIAVIRIMVGHLRTAMLRTPWAVLTARTQGFYLGRKGTSGCYCGGPLDPRALHAYVDKTAMLVGGTLVKVAPTIVRLCYALLRLPEGGSLSARQLEHRLYGEDLRYGVKQIEVQIFHLRAVLKDTPWRVKVRWRQGYYIEQEAA